MPTARRGAYLLTLLLLAGARALSADAVRDSETVRAFCDKAEAEYQRLYSLCPPNRKGHWTGRKGDVLAAVAEVQRTDKLAEEMIQKQPNAKEIMEVFPFSSLNRMNEAELRGMTRLVNDLGAELLANRVKERLSPVIEKLDGQLASLKGKGDRRHLTPALASYLAVKQRIAHIGDDVPVKASYVFAPMPNAWAARPDKIEEFVIRDWPSAFPRVDEQLKDLEAFENTVEAERFFTPQDPQPWLPIAVQLTFLLVAVAGYIIDYHDNPSILLLSLLITVSMTITIFLIYWSADTFMNLLSQSLVPGGFIGYWLLKKRGWFTKKATTPPTEPSRPLTV